VTLADLPTPSLLLDRDALDRNLRRMADRFAGTGVALRPHLKTAKCVEVARLARDLGARGLTISTLREAEFFFEHGFDDLVYTATPVGDKLDRAAALVRRGCKLRVTVEQVAGVELLATSGHRHGVTIDALIEIDSGEHRAGVLPDSDALLAIARTLAASRGARLAGVLTHGGHSYNGRTPQEIAAIAEQERGGVVAAAKRLRAAGFPCDIVSAGSTPSATHAASLDGLTEMRPGVYTLGDVFQARVQSHPLADTAATVLAAVIAHQRANGTVLIDAGAMALTKDRSTAVLPPEQDAGFGLIADVDGRVLDGFRLRSVFQEHGVIESRHGAPIDFGAFPLGRKLRVLPNHSCLTAAQFDFYHVHRGAEVIDRWERVRGW
jgi:D-serine deaminase-like pyridoxal phosphate-dependent protein